MAQTPDLMLRLAAAVPSQHLRRTIYRLCGVRLGRHAVIYGGAEIRSPRQLIIGESTVIGDACKLDARGRLVIGANVNLSSGVWIWTAQHDPQSPRFETVWAPVTIEDYAWLSCRTVILPGVTIGRGAVVAAGAVVTQDVAPFMIVGGVPSRVIGERTTHLEYCLSDTHYVPFR